MEMEQSTNMEGNITSINTSSSPVGLYPMVTERTVLHCAISPLIIFIGILGNIMTVCVLHQMKERTTTSQFLLSLAISDTTTLLIRSIYMVFVWAQLFYPNEVKKWLLNSYTFFKMSHATERVSKMTLVAIVIERVIAVYLPLQMKMICTRFRVRIIIILMYLIVIAMSLPNSIDVLLFDMNYQSKIKIYPMTQKDASEYLRFSLYKSPGRVIFNTLNRALFDFIPIPVVIICNVGIIIGLKRQKGIGASTKLNQRKEKERKLTRLLLSVSFCFLILCGPFDFYAFCVLTNTISISNNTLIMSEVFKTASLLNCSINFIIYAFMNKKYRYLYLQNFLSCFRCSRGNSNKRRSGSGSAEMSDSKPRSTELYDSKPWSTGSSK